MKIKLILIALCFVFGTLACQKSEDEKTIKFLNIYKEILIAREQTTDNAEAAEKINEILKQNGYSEPEFRKEFIRLSKEKPYFMKMMDSLRKTVIDEENIKKSLH